VDGGAETVVVDRVPRSHWSVTAKGVFFLRSERGFDALHVFDPTDASVRMIGRVPFQIARVGDIGRFTISRDGRWALTHQVEGSLEGSLMMIEDFR
jgi:hypothetical protein